MTCDLCDPAPHPNCEAYTALEVMDPRTQKTKVLDVCLEHYEAWERANMEGER